MTPARPGRARIRIGVVVAALALGTSAGSLAAQQADGPEGGSAAEAAPDPDAMPRPTARAHRTTGDLEMDGRLDEAAWDEAPVIDRFIQQKPDAGRPATERTEVRILYDDENLYIGAVMYDSNPDELVVPTLERDPNTRNGDAFGIALDTFHDEQNGFAFFINPAGAVRDQQVSDDGRNNNAEWEAAYDLETRIHDEGWTLEMALPWSTLRFDRADGEQVWGMNLLRRVRRKNEDAVWAPMDRQWGLFIMSRAGDLRGIEGVEPRRNLSVKPYVLGADPSGDLQSGPEGDAEFEVGGDLKYGLTPGLTLDLTVNTDFSQVEVDQQQVNLTRFNLFFPERREFFLENAGIFQFGDKGQFNQRTGATNRDFTLLQTRRIGLTPSGAPLPILGGGRVSGMMGPLSVGLLNIQTRGEGSFEPENFSVARLRGEPLPGLTAGGIFINRSSTSGTDVDNRSYGIDADYQGAGGNFLVESYIAATEGTDVAGNPVDRAWAGRLSATWRDPFWEVVGLYRHFDEAFEPGVGFVRRNGIDHLYGTVGIRPVVEWPLVQQVNPYLEAQTFTDPGGFLETRDLRAGLDLDFWDGATASLSVTDRFEGVQEPFSIRGVTVPAGEYDFTEAQVSYQSNPALPLSGQLAVTSGSFFNGDRLSVRGSVVGRLGYRAVLDLSVDHNRIELPDQPSTTADVYGARLNLFFSTEVLTSAFVQYNEASQELISNVRLNWIHAPLSNVFLVFTERRDVDAGAVLERVVTLKVTKLFFL